MAPALPVELIEAVVDVVDSHQDILSFALTCSYLHNIIKKNGYLEYRELAVSYGHKAVWEYIIAHPEYAAKVRRLNLYDNYAAAVKHRTFWRIPPTVSRNTESGLGGRTSLFKALPLLIGLEVVTLHINTPSGGPGNLVHAFFPCRTDSLSSLTLILNGPDLLDVNDLLWNSIKSLRVLNLSNPDPRSVLDVDLWPSYCSLLALNPRIEDLRVPSFLGDIDYRAKLPALPNLRILHIGKQGETTQLQFAFFAAAHPSIVEFSWNSKQDVQPGYIPNLPRLERLVNTWPQIVHAMLSGRPSGSVAVTELGYLDLSIDTLPVLSAVRETTLRKVKLESATWSTLASFAAKFLAIEELHILSPMPGNGWLKSMIQPSKPKLEDVLKLFPNLRAVWGVVASKSPEAVRPAYPHLRTVNGSRIDHT